MSAGPRTPVAVRVNVRRMDPVLTRRALNRATLERQLLLQRRSMPVMEAVEHLGGLQAQTAHTWYVGLWTRLERFDPDEVGRLLDERRVVRIGLMRSTIHLVTADDCLWLRPLLAPVLERPLSSFARHLVDLDRSAVADAGRALVERQPLTASALGRRLAERWPDRDEASLAQVCRARLALVQVPPRGVWGMSGPAAHTTAESWLGRPLAEHPSPDDLVLRYLAAFGPATAMDAQAWCGLTRLGEVTARLRPQLVVFRDEEGRELFDLPDAPRPDPDTPAPVRFLYDYDNLLLSHADRGRFFAGQPNREVWTGHGVIPGTVLVDGVARGSWTVAREPGAATLTVRPDGRLGDADAAEVAEEGERLLAFLAAGLAGHETAAAIALAINADDRVSAKTVVLLTPEQLDAAAEQSVEYRGPGS